MCLYLDKYIKSYHGDSQIIVKTHIPNLGTTLLSASSSKNNDLYTASPQSHDILLN